MASGRSAPIAILAGLPRAKVQLCSTAWPPSPACWAARISANCASAPIPLSAVSALALSAVSVAV